MLKHALEESLFVGGVQKSLGRIQTINIGVSVILEQVGNVTSSASDVKNPDIFVQFQREKYFNQGFRIAISHDILANGEIFEVLDTQKILKYSVKSVIYQRYLRLANGQKVWFCIQCY